jgi:hypothetical protein
MRQLNTDRGDVFTTRKDATTVGQTLARRHDESLPRECFAGLNIAIVPSTVQ